MADTVLRGRGVDCGSREIYEARLIIESRWEPGKDDRCIDDAPLSCPANLFFRYSVARGGDAARGGNCGELGRGGEVEPVELPDMVPGPVDGRKPSLTGMKSTSLSSEKMSMRLSF